MDVKEKGVGQNRQIDYHDEQIAQATSITPTNYNLVDVRSTIFHPPPDWFFLKFRDVATENWPKDDGDTDEDMTSGFADGFGKFGSPAGDTNFVPVVVDVKNAGDIDWGKARLRVICPLSDPSATELAGTAEKPYQQAAGIFRLWTQDGKTKRKPKAVDEKGDWIAPKEYAARLLIDSTTKTNTWYAEGIQEGGDEGEIAVEFDPLGAGEWLKDKVHVTVVHGDVDVDSDNDDGFKPPKRDGYEDRIEAAPLKYRGRSYGAVGEAPKCTIHGTPE